MKNSLNKLVVAAIVLAPCARVFAGSLLDRVSSVHPGIFLSCAVVSLGYAWKKLDHAKDARRFVENSAGMYGATYLGNPLLGRIDQYGEFLKQAIGNTNNFDQAVTYQVMNDAWKRKNSDSKGCDAFIESVTNKGLIARAVVETTQNAYKERTVHHIKAFASSVVCAASFLGLMGYIYKHGK